MTALIRSATLAAAIALVPAAADAQSVYRWVDKNGKVHYSDQPPPEEVKNVQQKKVGGGTVEVSQLPYATQVAMQKNPVVLYGALLLLRLQLETQRRALDKAHLEAEDAGCFDE